MQRKYIKTCRVQTKTKSFLSWFNYLLLFCLVLSSVYYIASSNDLTVKGFDLQKLQSEVKALSVKNNHKQNKVASLQAFQESKEKINNLNLVAINEITYIIVSDSDLMAKK
jgi:cell division protein FtsB